MSIVQHRKLGVGKTPTSTTTPSPRLLRKKNKVDMVFMVSWRACRTFYWGRLLRGCLRLLLLLNYLHALLCGDELTIRSWF